MTDNAAAPAERSTILVVDDTPQNLSLMSDLLETSFNVKLAPSGARALKIVASNPPDLILLDIMMPEMDGYEVCRQLKAAPESRDIPVIFLTAMDTIQDEEQGLSIGAADYITKPISPSILMARVRNQLALKQAADQLRDQNHQLAEEKSRARDLLFKLKDATDKLLDKNRAMKQEQEQLRELLHNVGNRLLAQGQLIAAWELWRNCPLNDAVLEDLYGLALAFERQAQLDVALAVFTHIANFNPQYRDVTIHLEHTKVQTSPGPASSPSETGVTQPASGMPKTLGRYQIHRVLGQGASGLVYLGSDPMIGRNVAIKTMTLASEFTDEELGNARERFFREAERAGGLVHPNIVSIYDVGEENGLCYIAMECLQGSDLTAHAAPGCLLPLATVLSIAERVAEALAIAHARGIVHRDIKPANIIYEAASDTVKVSDFGIASVMQSASKTSEPLMGSPSFMAPELIEGTPADGRSDLYSLGVTIYQLVCGQLPFRGDTLRELMNNIIHAPLPDIRATDQQLPDCLAAILGKAIAKSPSDRFQNSEEMMKALKLCRRSLSVFAS